MCAVRLLLARPVEGTVGERERVAHLLELPEEVQSRPARLRAFCGREFGPGELELLDRVTGMPCEPCLRKVPIERADRSLSSADEISARLAEIEAAVAAVNGRLDRLSALLVRAIEQVTGPSSTGATSGEV